MIYLFKNKYIKVALGVMCLFTLLFGVIALYLAIDFILNGPMVVSSLRDFFQNSIVILMIVFWWILIPAIILKNNLNNR